VEIFGHRLDFHIILQTFSFSWLWKFSYRWYPSLSVNISLGLYPYQRMFGSSLMHIFLWFTTSLQSCRSQSTDTCRSCGDTFQLRQGGWRGTSIQRSSTLIFFQSWMCEASLKSLRMFLSFMASWEVGELKSMVSSTNWLWEAVRCSPCKWRPWREPSKMEALM